MKIQVNSTFTVVRPNTSEDPINHCLNKMKYYNPIMSYELKIASEPYISNGQSCFDVYGDSGTKNKGQTEGTRKTFFYDIGIVPLGDRYHMECHGLTRAFAEKEEAELYIEGLLNDENYHRALGIALELWGINTEDKSVQEFIRMNNLNK